MQVDRLRRIRGCLLCGAVGDALGYEVEFITREEIIARFGPGSIRAGNRAVAGAMAADMETCV